MKDETNWLSTNKWHCRKNWNRKLFPKTFTKQTIFVDDISGSSNVRSKTIMMTSQKLHAKTFLQHGTENVFCITICVIHDTTHFSASFSYSCKRLCCFKNSFNSCSSCKLENSRVCMSNKNTHKKKSLYDDYANANKKCFFHIIFKILTLKNDANDPWHVGVRDLK